MTYTVLQKRSDTPNKRPLPAELLDGQLGVNFDTATAGLFFKNDTGGIIKAGPTAIGGTAPAPTEGGATQLGIGEQWLDTSNENVNVLKIWNGTEWLSVGAGGGGDTPGSIGFWTQQANNIYPTLNTVSIYSNIGLKCGGTFAVPRFSVDGLTGNVTTVGNVTTSDLEMNNLHRPDGNEVDGTRGHWVFQEGSEDLFLINRVTGKKYAFELREV